MKNIKLNKILLLLIILLCIGCILYICLTSFRKDKESTKKQIDEIEEYNYRLYETDLTQYKKLFHELKNILKSSTVDEEKYVQLIAKMFVMDFYTLQNKTSSDDVGGTDFIYSDVLSNFKEKSKDTLYLFLENELNHKEKLPSVDNVVIENIDTTLYTYLKKTDSKSFKVDVTISYEKDLDYDQKKTLYFVHEGKKLSLVEIA